MERETDTQKYIAAQDAGEVDTVQRDFPPDADPNTGFITTTPIPVFGDISVTDNDILRQSPVMETINWTNYVTEIKINGKSKRMTDRNEDGGD